MDQTAGHGVPAHRVVIVGGGFGGLFAARALRRERRRDHARRPRPAPPVPAAALPGGDRDPVRGPDRGARCATCSSATATSSACWPRSSTSTSRPGGSSPQRPGGERIDAALRRPDRRRRRPPVLLRARRVRAVGARDEDDRRRARDPPQGVRRVRAGRDRRPTPTSSAGGSRSPWSAPARPGWSSPDRSASSPPARCARSSGASGPRTPGSCCSTAAARRSRPSGPRCRPRRPRRCATWGSSCTWHRSSPTWTATGLEVRDQAGTTVRHEARDRALGGRRRGAAGRRGARRRPPGRAQRPRRSHRGAAGPHDPGSPGDLRGRGHDGPGQAARRRRGRHAVGALRRPPDPAPDRRPARPAIGPFRYHDLGSAAYISRGHAVVSAGPLQLAGLAGWLGWLFIHIAFLTGYRNRVGAVLTWAAAFARDARRERTFTIGQIEEPARRLRRTAGRPGPKHSTSGRPVSAAPPMTALDRRLLRHGPRRSAGSSGSPPRSGWPRRCLVIVQAELLADGVARAFLGGAGLAELAPRSCRGCSPSSPAARVLGWARGGGRAPRRGGRRRAAARRRWSTTCCASDRATPGCPPTGELATLATPRRRRPGRLRRPLPAAAARRRGRAARRRPSGSCSPTGSRRCSSA